nr:hypothetical protein [Candidatus Njordarchaeota archaeon]
MSFNRVKLSNEVVELRAKTLGGAPLVEMLIRGKTIAKSLRNQEMIRWIESETNTTEGTYYTVNNRTRGEMNKLAPYRAVRAKHSFPPFSDIDSYQFPKIRGLCNFFLNQRPPYFCTTPVGILEENQESGVEVSLPNEYRERILAGADGQNKSIVNFVFSYSSLIIPPDSIRGILDGVKGKLVDYLDKIIQDRPMNIIDVFYQSMDHLYNDVKKLYPDIIGEFETIHTNIVQNKPESFSNVASACRRILKKFADAESPPKKEATPNGHELTEGHEKNRIIEWIKVKITGTTQTELVSAHLELLAKYINSVYGLASKGDKNPITKYEAELCSIHTYFIIAELIRIKQSATHLTAE